MSAPEQVEIAQRVIARILEDAAFVFTDALDPAEKPLEGQWAADGVRLAFAGYATGELHMWASDGFARIAAANMLGVDVEEEGAAEKGMDALKEILNMIVGNYLTDVYGTEPIFDLSIPSPLDTDRLDEDVAAENGIWFAADEHAVLFRILPQ